MYSRSCNNDGVINTEHTNSYVLLYTQADNLE